MEPETLNNKYNVMYVIEIVDVYGESLCLLMPSVFWNIGGLGEFYCLVWN